MNLSNGLKLFAVGIAVVLLLLTAISDYRNSLTRIGSEDYHRVVTGKDLIADINPPRSFIVDAYLTIVQASQEPWNRDAYFQEYRAEKDAYFEQLKRWEKADIPDDIRKLITVDSPTVLDRFWIEAENNFFPKLENSGGIGLGAAEINQSLGVLKERFKEHKAIVLRASQEAEAYLKSVEADSNAHMRELGWIYYAAAGISLLLIAGFLVALNRAVVRPLVNIAGYTTDLARGHTDADVPYVHRGDEVGSIAKALTVFKEVAAEKLESERHAATERQRMADIKAQADADLAEKAEATRRAVAILGDALNRLADGELDCEIDEHFQGELESLRHDFNMALGGIADVFTQIAVTATSIESGTQEIFTASDDLSRRTEQQAASLEQTSATLDQITATVQKSAEGAENTRKIVNAARGDAESSGDVVNRALAAMSDIEKSAAEINEIISVIDEIAFQTNLLALNAGVEAARAGDAGKGFAVVAQEVRELAQRSAGAAKEIKTLISKSSSQVSSGSQLVNATGETLHRIAGQVVEISVVVDQIASGANEQFIALKQLNTAVGDMDSATQQNAAMAEQATAASHSLSQEAENLAALIARFRVADRQFEARSRQPNPTPQAARPAARPRKEIVRRAQGAFRGRSVGNAAIKDEWEEF
ncbi:methyl-accepting chemotaxis protein [Oricola nitratireducens]|uniref:methyl-accepting chemotaxis protein n=1 Tax=Oricola nitratireducens TaxID=2775868 RepID=UPI001866FBD2|nr:methyl-accepting chemotaxis protein [Oricola nitratireducens]